MAKAKAGVPHQENRLVRYLKETWVEIKKVTWPTRDEAMNLTGIVLAATVFMAILLGLLDYLFSQFFAFLL